MSQRRYPSAEQLAEQWAAQAGAHRIAAQRPLKEKIATLLAMQRQLLPVIAARRPLREWERPWEIDP
jgi:hypothetical protein